MGGITVYNWASVPFTFSYLFETWRPLYTYKFVYVEKEYEHKGKDCSHGEAEGQYLVVNDVSGASLSRSTFPNKAQQTCVLFLTSVIML